MKLIDMRCPACCAHLNVRGGSRMVRCEYCDSRFAIDDAEILGISDIDDDEEDGGGDEPSPFLPIEEFAAKKCQQFLEDHADARKEFKSTPKILRGLDIPDGETVYLIHDDTLMKSGKDGFAITERGLYCRPMSDATVFYSWDKFSGLPQPSLEDSYVVCRGRRIAYLTGRDSLKEDLLELYNRLHRHVRDAR